MHPSLLVRKNLGLLAAFAGSWSLACGSGGVHYSGTTTAQHRLAAQVVELSHLPSNARVLGAASAECEQPAAGELRDATLSDLVCSEQLLRVALRRKAAAVGGSLLVDVQCESSPSPASPSAAGGSSLGTAECEATVAVSDDLKDTPEDWELQLGSTPFVDSQLAEAVLDAFRIYVDADWTATASAVTRGVDPKLGRSQIVPTLPAFDRPLAHVRARCEQSCDETSLQRAVVAGATHLGARHVVLSECTRLVEEVQCVGIASAPHL